MAEVLGKRSNGVGLSDKVTKKLKSQGTTNPSAALTSASKKNNGETVSNKKSKKTVSENQEEEQVIEQPAGKTTPVKKGQAKKVYLSTDEIPRRIKELQQRVEELTGPENANKRKRVLQRLTQLKKAAGNPEELLVDPDEELKRVAMEKDRRIQKKLEKSERQKRENRSVNKKNAFCIICKQRGHVAGTCIEGKTDPSMAKELDRHVCFNCGSREHALRDCPDKNEGYLYFATCFYCKEKGHLSRDCPKNEEGIYHKGGCCYECGSKRHLAKECPERAKRFNPVQNFTTGDEGNAQQAENYENVDYGDKADENDIFSDEDA